MCAGRLQLLVQLIHPVFACMAEQDIIVLDGAAPEHLNLSLLRNRGTLDGGFHLGRDGIFALVERHVNDVEVACLQHLEQEPLLLAVLVILEFCFHVICQRIPWTQNVLQTRIEEIIHIVEF